MSQLISWQSLPTCFTGSATPVIQSQRLRWRRGRAVKVRVQVQEDPPTWPEPHKSKQEQLLDTQRDLALLLKPAHLQFSSTQLSTLKRQTWGRHTLSKNSAPAAGGLCLSLTAGSAMAPSAPALVVTSALVVATAPVAATAHLPWYPADLLDLASAVEPGSPHPSQLSRSTGACWPLWTWKSTPASRLSAHRKRNRSRPSTTASPASSTRSVFFFIAYL